jgi:hypothetical protein
VASIGQCENCGAPLYGKYCYACGQPTQGLVRHFGSVMSDVADSILNVDERLFRTLGPLYLRPGKLTLDYFEGKRARYVTPFRLVFFLAIVAFFAIQLTVRSGFTSLPREAVHISTGSGGPTVSVTQAPKAPPAPVSSDHGAFAQGNIVINDKVWWNRDTKPLKVAWLPGVVVDWLNDSIGNAQQQLHAMNEGSFGDQQEARRKFTLGMFSAAPTALFLLLPHAGWLKVPLYLLTAAAWIWMFVYLWLMQKRIYKHGWSMTDLKYWSLGFCCLSMLGCGSVFAVLLSLTGA